ncbi:hypothetical protein HDU89_008445 [Geranomyces variabilis]|nr:hypothetical protein HDU89_008445 [Geranomyces variabilis]
MIRLMELLNVMPPLDALRVTQGIYTPGRELAIGPKAFVTVKQRLLNMKRVLIDGAHAVTVQKENLNRYYGRSPHPDTVVGLLENAVSTRRPFFQPHNSECLETSDDIAPPVLEP